MQPIIKIENLSKMYRLGVVGTGTLTHDLKRWYYRMRGWEDPYLKIGEANVSNTKSKSKSDYIWALKDINLEVMPGEVLGIIGKNGAGKSTLLKILSKVTGPTTGSIDYNGRIGALLEVGTGFHPELTGRENIFLNGAILGMTKAEIKGKLEEIIDFSGVERYIDTPVKRYSSGMMVRLGFAVAAHLEPEILIVDEVLAVGDAEFQKKAIGKMQDVSKNEGRTVLFVSHNMGAVRSLCTRGVLLKNGLVDAINNIDNIVDRYVKGSVEAPSRVVTWENDHSKPISITEGRISVDGKTPDQSIEINDRLKVQIKYSVNNEIRGSNIGMTLIKEGIPILHTFDIDSNNDNLLLRKKGFYTAELFLPSNLNTGNYTITISAGLPGIQAFERYDECLSFEIENFKIDSTHKAFSRGGILIPNIIWKTKYISR